MNKKAIQLLLVEDNETDVLVARDELSNSVDVEIEVVQVDRLRSALHLLESKTFDVVVLDLNLPDSEGLDTFVRFRNAAPNLPVVVASHRSDEGIAIQAVKAGAQDYLVKGHTDGMLVRTIRYAIERAQVRLALRTTEEELVRARDAAEHANRTKSLFLTTASHDLRQPTQALNMLISTLERLADTTPLQEIARMQRDALEAMTGLLNGLLDISKLEAGAVKPQPTDFQLKLTFEHMRNAFALQAQKKGIEFVVDTTHAIVHTDRILLERIIENLVANAIRYTQQGKVRLRCIEQPVCIRIEVIDTGIGIPVSALRTILNEFHQVRDTHDRSPNEGLGLGLAIVDRMANLLNIPMDVQSTPGEGSTFSIEIPIGTSAADTTAPPSATDTRKSLAGIQALVVDDDFGVRNALQMLLEIEGCKVTEAASLAEAVDGAIATPPDIIITDYHLPDAETGTGVVQRVREQTGQPVPAILISGDTSSALRAHLLEGCLLLSKPVVTSEFIASILDLARPCTEPGGTTSPNTVAS